MCGFAGYLSFQLPARRSTVEKMLKEMVHRGPDDYGIHEDALAFPHIVLGHRRLSILDLSQAGHQPMANEDGTLWIVFNGEIYNYLELRKDLVARGHKFHSETDTETILHLYEEHGTECVSYLRGMFAFAIWDSKNRDLFLARDRVGKKPIYYAQVPGGFFFASEIHALFPVDKIGRTLDLVALDLYFAYSYIPSPYSIFQEIRKLPPACTLVVQSGGFFVRQYWSLDFSPKLEISFSEAKEQLLSHLEESTRIRLRSDVPLGCFLSGGVDSSSIVAMMARCSTSRIKTFSIGFPEKEYDETSYARTISSLYDTEHHECIVEPLSIEVLPELVRHYGEPFADSSALPSWYLSELTARHVTVVLNGDGGDEAFAGYNKYYDGLRLETLSRVLPQSLARSANRLIRLLPGKKADKIRFMLHLLSLNPAERFAELRTEIKSSVRRSLYSSEVQEERENAVKNYLASLYARAKGEGALDRMLYTDTFSYLPEELLVKMDRATMAHSLEARSPLLDHRLLEFAARLPSKYKISGKAKKHILVEAVSPLFPEGFLNRPKMGFCVPLHAWFRGKLNGYVQDRILHGKMASSGLFQLSFLHRVLADRVPSLANSSGLIWRLLILAEWFEQHSLTIQPVPSRPTAEEEDHAKQLISRF